VRQHGANTKVFSVEIDASMIGSVVECWTDLKWCDELGGLFFASFHVFFVPLWKFCYAVFSSARNIGRVIFYAQ
jgi:hypothetical protein